MPFTSFPAPWISPVCDSCSPVLASSPSLSTRSPKPLSMPPRPDSKPPAGVFSVYFFVIWLISVNLNAVPLPFGFRHNFGPLWPQAQVLHGNDILRHQDRTTGGRPELAHISGPAVGQHSLHRRRRKPLDRLGKLDVGDIHEPLRQVRDVLPALAQ